MVICIVNVHQHGNSRYKTNEKYVILNDLVAFELSILKEGAATVELISPLNVVGRQMGKFGI